MSTDKAPEASNYLVQDRHSRTKAFSYDNSHLGGRTQLDTYNSYKDYKDVSTLHKTCILYATAYTETMLTRAKAEDPDIFAMKGMSKSEMQTHLAHNMCLPYSKLHSKVFRETTAKIHEKNYLNDDIRRLYNDGDKFHPYL